jgi:hypothetical protein
MADNNEQLKRKIDTVSGMGYYDHLPEGWKVGMWSDFINRVGELRVGMEYIIESYHPELGMPYQVYHVNDGTTRDKLKEWAGRIYVKG